jgi:hypothetical protein
MSHETYIFKPLSWGLESLAIHDSVDIALANEVTEPRPNLPYHKRNRAPWCHDNLVTLPRESRHQAKMPFLCPAKTAIK